MNLDLYSRVIDLIIERLETGVVPWQSPYFSKVGFPTNFASGKPYRGINVLLLALRRDTSPYFLTYLQAQELGGQVRKGAKGCLVVKYGTFTKAGDQATSVTEAARKRGFLKSYTVFHSSQIDGISFPDAAIRAGRKQRPTISNCDRPHFNGNGSVLGYAASANRQL